MNCRYCGKKLSRYELHEMIHCIERLQEERDKQSIEIVALKSELAEQEAGNNRITAANMALRAELENVKTMWRKTIAGNQHLTGEYDRLRHERDAANERLERALDWLMAKHGGRLDAAESVDARLYDILEGK